MFVEESKTYAIAPAGVHLAVCSRFVDLGTRYNELYEKKQHRVMISWQIPDERVEVDGADLPLQHSEFYTWSMHPDANLRKALESWRNKPFTTADLAGPPSGFDTRKLIGVGCQLQIMHNDKGKAVVSAILPIPKRDDWPKIEGDSTYFQMQSPPMDMAAFKGLSDGLKKSIQDSEEWEKANASVKDFDDGRDPMEDSEIPF